MNFHVKLARVGVLGLTMLAPLLNTQTVGAVAAPQLVISQFKITSSGGQFITLHNQSSAGIDLAQYEFDYINSSGKITNFPMTGQLASRGFYMLNDDQLRLCYQMTVSSVSLGLATTNGTVQIWQVSADKMTKQLQDTVTWASKAATGAVTLPTQNAASTVSLLRQPMDSTGNPQITAPASGSWQAVVPDVANACVLNKINTSTPVVSPSNNPANQLSVGQAPPTTTVTITNGSDNPDMPMIPAADVGLSAPQITEALPNPDGTGNDGEEEFIELYNPNSAPFHLVGFVLQTGLTTKHKYTFPDGTILPPQSFMAFYSIDTKLSLSNTTSQAALLDPFGTVLSQTDVYDKSKEGQTWALADGKWHWSTKATPGAMNVVEVAAPSGKLGASNTTSKTGSVKGAATTKQAVVAPATPAKPAESASKLSPTHPYILASVAALAVGYGIYEYRHDLGNRLHQFREHRAARRNSRPQLARR